MSERDHPFGLPDTQVAAIVQAVLQLGRRLRAQRPADSVSLATLSLLATLHRKGPMPAARLAEAVRLQPQSLTRLLKEMEEKGLIEREPGGDKRTLILSLTEAGRAALRYDIAARHGWLRQEIAVKLEADEQDLLLRAAAVMQKLADED